MTATYSEKRADKSAPFHLHATAASDSDASESLHRDENQTEYLEALRTTVGAPGAALDTHDWAGIDQVVCAAKPLEFAHAHEKEFARMLDARDIQWQYKPRTFAVEWDKEGNFVDCFTPDFYLAENQTYIALITPGCSESTLKARKVKLLRRQHPEIRIEVMNGPYRPDQSKTSPMSKD